MIDLYRNGFQETVEVEVMSADTERFFKRNGIQIDLEDKTYMITLTAKLPGGKTIEQDKVGMFRTEFDNLAKKCQAALVQ